MRQIPSIPAILLLAAILTIATSCTTTKRQQFESVPSRIQRGSTTRSEVLNLLGEPNHKRIKSGAETWIYGGRHERSSDEMVLDQAIGIGAGFAPVPYLGSAINGVRSIDRASRSSRPGASVTFNKEGTVKDYVVDLPQNGGNWGF